MTQTQSKSDYIDPNEVHHNVRPMVANDIVQDLKHNRLFSHAVADPGCGERGGGGGAHPSKSSMWWVGDPIMK